MRTTTVRFAGLRRCATAVAYGACVVLAGLATPVHAAPPDELLEPERAFRISTEPLDDRNVQVRFEIAEGYYMYRDRFKFQAESGQVLADVELPPGERRRDPFFGETETYRRQVSMRVPFSDEDAASGRVKLKVTSQGCSDQGVCYTPLEQRVTVQLASASAAASTLSGDTRSTAQRERDPASLPVTPSFWALIVPLLAIAGVIAAVGAARKKRRNPQ